MFRCETRYIVFVLLMISLTISLYRIISYSIEYKANQEKETNLNLEVEQLKRQTSSPEFAENYNHAETRKRDLSLKLDAIANENINKQGGPASVDIFIEANNYASQGRKFYKLAGSTLNHDLYKAVKLLPRDKQKRILITGGAGFVGSHLVDSLMLDGHEIIVCDNFLTGRKSNVEHWEGHHNFQLIDHDVVDPITVRVNEIYHLASPASPIHYMADPIKTIKTNTIGTINMLGLAKTMGARIVIASSSEIYGDPAIHPQAETYWGNTNPIGPRSCYDESKRLSESLAMAYNLRENVSVGIARIFNTYGPRMHPNDGRVVSNFIIQSLSNQSITVYGSGKQTRSFQYVSDLISGLKKLMESDVTHPVNLGNPSEIIIQSLALQIKSIVPFSSSDIVFKDLPVDDPHRRKPDITKARTLLGWEPIIALSEGLRRTVNYFKQETEIN